MRENKTKLNNAAKATGTKQKATHHWSTVASAQLARKTCHYGSRGVKGTVIARVFSVTFVLLQWFWL